MSLRPREQPRADTRQARYSHRGASESSAPRTPGAKRASRSGVIIFQGVARAAIVIMTSSSHNGLMREVRIAELKARLSEYLRVVRRGETLAVLDRDTPIARIVPVTDRPTLRVRKPAPGTPAPNRVRLPKPAALALDVVELLLEERRDRR